MNIEFKISKKPVNYEKALKLLEKRVRHVKEGGRELVWFLEHPLTYTAGIRSKKEEILDKSINLIKTNRGGKITLHNPGQQIVYFVINLNKRKKDIRNFISIIEKTIIKTLKSYNINTFADKKNIGIWYNDKGKEKKVAAIGVRVSKWIAYHGFSININNDLSKYNAIIPCGIRNKGVTSLKKISDQNYKDLDQRIVKNFISNLEI